MKLRRIWLLLLTVLLIGGCSTRVRTEEELLLYAQQRYGECTLAAIDHSGERELICRMRDSQYGFEYTVTSKVTDVGMDGTKFWESESTYDSFQSSLTRYILEQDDRLETIAGKYHAAVETGADDHSPVILRFQEGYADLAEQAAVQIASVLREYERNRVYESDCVEAYDSRKEFLGQCEIHGGGWQSKEEVDLAFYQEKARNLHRGAGYLRTEHLTFGETGVPLSEVNNPMWDTEHITGSSSPVTYYYFEADGREFVIADFYVKKSDDGTGGLYTNYYEVFPPDSTENRVSQVTR